MLNLIYRYKVLFPRLKFDPPAKNYEAARKWASAGYRGWPSAPLLETDLTVQCQAPNNIRAMILVLIGDRWAVPPITSNSSIGNAIAAGRPTASENKCCVAAILESLGSFSHKKPKLSSHKKNNY
jgi:hypothetical protein